MRMENIFTFHQIRLIVFRIVTKENKNTIKNILYEQIPQTISTLSCECIKLSGRVIFQQHPVLCQSHQLHHHIAMCSVIHSVSYETSLYQAIAQQASE